MLYAFLASWFKNQPNSPQLAVGVKKQEKGISAQSPEALQGVVACFQGPITSFPLFLFRFLVSSGCRTMVGQGEEIGCSSRGDTNGMLKLLLNVPTLSRQQRTPCMVGIPSLGF